MTKRKLGYGLVLIGAAAAALSLTVDLLTGQAVSELLGSLTDFAELVGFLILVDLENTQQRSG